MSLTQKLDIKCRFEVCAYLQRSRGFIVSLKKEYANLIKRTYCLLLVEPADLKIDSFIRYGMSSIT